MTSSPHSVQHDFEMVRAALVPMAYPSHYEAAAESLTRIQEQLEALRAVADHHIAEAERSEKYAEDRDLVAQRLEEQLEAVRQVLEQIAGPTPTSHRKTVDQLTDAVKWRQGMARDALTRLDSSPASSLPEYVELEDTLADGLTD